MYSDTLSPWEILDVRKMMCVLTVKAMNIAIN